MKKAIKSDWEKMEPNCIECKKYFGHPEKDNKCSYCYIGKIGIYDKGIMNEQYRKELKIFVESKLIDKKMEKMIEKAFKKNAYNIMLHLHDIIRKNKKYITAEFAGKILNKYGRNERKSHIICSLIIDWWNMMKYKFNGTEACYYGHFMDPYEIEERVNSIPPQLNNYFGLGSLEKFVMDRSVSVSSNSKVKNSLTNSRPKSKLTKAERRKALKTRK